MRAKHGEPPFRKQAVQRLRARVREIRVGRVGRLEPFEHGRLEFRVGKRGRERVERRARISATRLAEEGQLRCVVRALAQHNVDDVAVAAQHLCMIRFRKIVIVTGHPEHRHHRHTSLALEPVCQRDRRECLVHGIQRPREQAGLLPRRDGEHFTCREPIAARSR